MTTLSWLNPMKTVRIDPSQANLQDRTYYFPCYERGELLLRSVKEVGILNPPCLQERPGARPIPVLGRRRLRAAVEAGMSEIEARVIPETVPAQEAFIPAFWDNFGHRTFDSALTAVVVRRLMELYTVDTVAKDFLPALGIPPRGPRLERFRAVGGLEEQILEALALGKITMRTAVVLTRVTPAERLALFGLTQKLRLNANKAGEVIGHLFDLSVLHGRSLLELVRSEEVETIVEDDLLDLPSRASALRELVRRWKFPELSEQMSAFRSWHRGLDTGERIFVRPSPDFEDERVSVEIDVNSWKETERVVETIRKLIG
jgi:ParB-like chromosome segregation protein Spo0J